MLSHLFKEHLHQLGVSNNQIIKVALDKKQYEAMRNPNTLYQYVVEKIEGQDKQFYLNARPIFPCWYGNKLAVTALSL